MQPSFGRKFLVVTGDKAGTYQTLLEAVSLFVSFLLFCYKHGMVLNEMSKQHTYGQGAVFLVAGRFWALWRNWIGISHHTLLEPYLYLLFFIFHLQSHPQFLLMGWDEASTSKRLQATVTGLWQGSFKLMNLIYS